MTYDFLQVLLSKFYWTTFKKNQNYISSGGLSRDYYLGMDTQNSWFSRFFENISASFWYFFIKSFLKQDPSEYLW